MGARISNAQYDLFTVANLVNIPNYPLDADDPIYECGDAVLSTLKSRPAECVSLAHQMLHSRPYKDVPTSWRRLYEDASILQAGHILQAARDTTLQPGDIPAVRQKRSYDGALKAYQVITGKSNASTQPTIDERTGSDWLGEFVRPLDLAIILAGAPRRRLLIENVFAALEAIARTSSDDQEVAVESFPCDQAVFHAPQTIARSEKLDFVAFQGHLDGPATPMITTGVLDSWPAMTDPDRQWCKPGYLLSRTLGGRRLVPVELGRSYTDEGWGQQIMTFAEYLNEHLLHPKPGTTGYLAQHDLFDQIPQLSADIVTPDYCYTDPPAATASGLPAQPLLDEPLRNAWLGPAGTISPLHTDPYHNILAQVVGYKYVRLYAPSETAKLYPRGVDESGVSMENTSHVDVSLARHLFGDGARSEAGIAKDSVKAPQDSREAQRLDFESRYPAFKDAQYLEGVLCPGECLYIPVGWWHYVESLSISFSVSFWWN